MKKIIIILICFCQSYHGITQEALDLDLTTTYTQKTFDSLLTRNVTVYQLGQILKNNIALTGWHHYYYRKSYISLNEKHNKDSALYYANKGIKAFEQLKVKDTLDYETAIKIYLNKALGLQRSQDYTNSIQSYQKALDLEKNYPYKWKSFLIAGISDNHIAMGNDSLAIAYRLKTIKDSVYMRLDRPAVTTYTRLGALYSGQGKPQVGKHYFLKALERSEQSETYKNNIPSIYLQLAYTEYSITPKNKELIKEYLTKAIRTREKKPSAYEIENEELELIAAQGIILLESNAPQLGVKKLKEVLEEYYQLDKYTKSVKTQIEIIYNFLSDYFMRTSQPKAINDMYKEHVIFLENFHKQKTDEDLQELEVSYQTKEKDTAIQSLEENQEQQKTIINQQQIITYSLIGFIILFVGLTFLFWRQIKLQNKYERENLKQRLLLSQMNPHFVSNALQSISLFVEKKSIQTIPYINKLTTLFRLILTNSREDYIGLDEEILTLESYLDLQSQFSENFDYEITVTSDINIGSTIIPPMLIQPFVENAIIHGLNKQENGKVEVQFSKKEGQLICKIQDNGTGYDVLNVNEKKQYPSVSSNIVKERLEILRKRHKTKSYFTSKSNDKGTIVDIYMPYILD